MVLASFQPEVLLTFLAKTLTPPTVGFGNDPEGSFKCEEGQRSGRKQPSVDPGSSG